MEYKCFTFRGFDFADDFEKAWHIAERMLHEIRQDGFGIEFCWVVIEDLSTNKKKIISSVEDGQYSSTHWLKM